MPTEYIGGIALIGDPGSGKTSIAEELASALDWGVRSFSTGIKNDVAKMLSDGESRNWTTEIISMAMPETKDNYRPLLQALGFFQRAENPDYWLDRLLRRMSPDAKYVIDDCRYFNEYEALRARGFKFVYLQRGPTTRALPAEQAAHESEQDWHRFKTDIVLTYEPGPKHQAERIIRMLKLNGDIAVECTCPNAGCSCPNGATGIPYWLAQQRERDARGQGHMEIDAATKGLAGAVATFDPPIDNPPPLRRWQEVAAEHLVDQGPDDVMDNSLFDTIMPGDTQTMTLPFTPPYSGRVHLHFEQVVDDEESVA